MDPKHESIAFGVRMLAEKGIIRKPSVTRRIVGRIIGRESYDKRAARQIEAYSKAGVGVVKAIKPRRKLRKTA